MSYKNNKFEISAPTWNEEFELSGGSYSTSGIQDYFEYIYKKKTWTKDSQSFTNDQLNARVLYAFAPNKSFGQLLHISPKSLKTLDSEFRSGMV